MGVRYLLDTNICIYIAKHNPRMFERACSACLMRSQCRSLHSANFSTAQKEPDPNAITDALPSAGDADSGDATH